jgi:hypothetical protein
VNALPMWSSKYLVGPIGQAKAWGDNLIQVNTTSSRLFIQLARESGGALTSCIFHSETNPTKRGCFEELWHRGCQLIGARS